MEMAEPAAQSFGRIGWTRIPDCRGERMAYTSMDQIPVVLTVEQLADILGIAQNTAYDFVRSGRIKSVRVGRQIRISKIDLTDLLNAD